MNNIRRLRKKHGLKLTELAEKLNFDKGNLSKMETKGDYLTINNAIIIANFFNVSTDYLLGFSESPTTIHNYYNYFTDSSSLITLEDIVKKYNHSDFMIIFNNDFIKLIFNDPGKAEVIYKRVK